MRHSREHPDQHFIIGLTPVGATLVVALAVPQTHLATAAAIINYTFDIMWTGAASGKFRVAPTGGARFHGFSNALRKTYETLLNVLKTGTKRARTASKKITADKSVRFLVIW